MPCLPSALGEKHCLGDQPLVAAFLPAVAASIRDLRPRLHFRFRAIHVVLRSLSSTVLSFVYCFSLFSEEEPVNTAPHYGGCVKMCPLCGSIWKTIPTRP